MPYARHRKSTTRGRTTTVRGGVRPKRVKVPPRPKRKPKSYIRQNAMQINRLSRSVARLKASEFGQKQYLRQTTRSLDGLPNGVLCRPSADFPVCWLHQLIGEGTQIFQVRASPAPSTEVEIGLIARWATQPMPLSATFTNAEVYNTLKYKQLNNLGAQIPYLHTRSVYEFSLNARQWEGWFELVHVVPRKQFTRQGTPLLDDFQMPAALIGMSNTCGGTTPNQWALNPMMFSCKVLKRLYFNTAATVNPQQLHTNPRKSFRVIINNDKYRSHIRAQKDASIVNPAITTHADVALHQQDWLVIRVSNPAPPTANSALDVYVKRANTWRDFLGGS